MNMPNILDFLDDERVSATDSRREALRKVAKIGGGLALASVPMLASPRLSRAQDASAVVAVLNYALTLEYLEDSYYRQGLAASGLIPDEARDVYNLISEHESAHVELLDQAIRQQNTDTEPVSYSDDDFDFTAGGAFDPFGNYDMFLLLSQGFEDTGVRAYKGQAPKVVGSPLLPTALRIHAMEARHAAEVRRLRDARGADVTPWIELDSGTDGTALEAVYGAGDGFPAEENTMQAGVDLTTLGDGFSAEEASAAFDEPLDMDTVKGIADPFTKNDLDGDGDTTS